MIEIAKRFIAFLREIVCEFLDMALCYIQLLRCATRNRGIEKGTFSITIHQSNDGPSITVQASDKKIVFHDNPSMGQIRYTVVQSRKLIFHIQHKGHSVTFTSSWIFSRSLNILIRILILLAVCAIIYFLFRLLITEVGALF